MKMSILFLVLLAAAQPAFAQTATANLEATDGTSPLQGKVNFEETSDGMKVTADIENATPGTHGFHVHQNGNCGDLGKAAGDHFNPRQTPHGFLPEQGTEKAHAGDLGNIEIDQDGKGHLELTVPHLTLSEGEFNIAGRAVVMHAKPDDFGQPAGNAGDRVGCGVIEVTQ